MKRLAYLTCSNVILWTVSKECSKVWWITMVICTEDFRNELYLVNASAFRVFLFSLTDTKRRNTFLHESKNCFYSFSLFNKIYFYLKDMIIKKKAWIWSCFCFSSIKIPAWISPLPHPGWGRIVLHLSVIFHKYIFQLRALYALFITFMTTMLTFQNKWNAQSRFRNARTLPGRYL